MGDNAWPLFLTPLPLLAVLLFAPWLFPLRPEDKSAAPLTPEELRDYRRWEIWCSLSFLPLASGFGYLWYLALSGTAGLFHAASLDTKFFVRPTIFWGIPALFLGFVTALIPLDGLSRVVLRDRYRKFEAHSRKRLPLDGDRLLVAFATAVLAGSVVWFVAGVTSYAKFGTKGFEIGRPFSFRGTLYDYADVKGIEHRATLPGPLGNTIDDPHYVYLLKDGSSWSTRAGCHSPDRKRDEAVAQWVALRSGLPVVQRP